MLSKSNSERFSKLLEQIGSPAEAPKNRKGGKGRQKGEDQKKREKQPVVWKNKLRKTRLKVSTTSSKNSVTLPNSEMNQEDFIKWVKSKILDANFTLDEIVEALKSQK